MAASCWDCGRCVQVITVCHEDLFVKWFKQAHLPALLQLEEEGMWGGGPLHEELIDFLVDGAVQDWKKRWRERRARRAAEQSTARTHV